MTRSVWCDIEIIRGERQSTAVRFLRSGFFLGVYREAFWVCAETAVFLETFLALQEPNVGQVVWV